MTKNEQNSVPNYDFFPGDLISLGPLYGLSGVKSRKPFRVGFVLASLPPDRHHTRPWYIILTGQGVEELTAKGAWVKRA
jgi:hypothetical protein